MSKMIRLLLVGGSCSSTILRPEEMHLWLHSAACGLAEWKKDGATVESAWSNLGGETMSSAIYSVGDLEYFSAVPIEAKQAVLLLAGDLLGGMELRPKRFNHLLEQVCALTAREASMHVRHSSQLLFELGLLSNGGSTRRIISNRELFQHTPLARFLSLCQPIILNIPLELIQASIQSEVYRRVTNGNYKRITVVGPPNMSFVDNTLLQFVNLTPKDLIYSVKRSTLDKLFNGLFGSRASESPYFTFNEDAETLSLSIPGRAKDGDLSLNIIIALYRGLGRALALSIVLGVPLGFAIFSNEFLKYMMGGARSTFDLERELRKGFYEIIPREVLLLTGEELSHMWTGALGRLLRTADLPILIRFASGSSESAIAAFNRQIDDNPAFQTKLLQKAVGVSYLPVGRVDAVYPPITVTFTGSEKGVFRIQSGDETYHMIDLN